MAGEAKGGFLGRLFSGKAADGEPKKKPVKAKLGAKNEFFYDEELKCWREKGKPPPADAGPPPPPPSLGLGSRTGSSGQELGIGALPPGGDGGMQPMRSWSNNSIDSGLPAPTTPTATSSTYFSDGPSAGNGPAAQSPFRARNLRAAPAARYAASSLIPTAPGTAGATAFASPGKPPLAPAPGGVAMFNPGAAAGGGAAPSFFIPGGGAQAAAPQGPFFGGGARGGRARGRQPAFEDLAEEPGEGERFETTSLKAPADQELLSPRDKRAKMDQGFNPSFGEESVGDNLGPQGGGTDEATSPAAVRLPPSFMPPSLESASVDQTAVPTDLGFGLSSNAMTAFPTSADMAGNSDIYASRDAAAYDTSYAGAGAKGFGGGETDAEGGIDGGFGTNPDPLASGQMPRGFGSFVQHEEQYSGDALGFGEQYSGDPLGFGGEDGQTPGLMGAGGDPFGDGGFGGGDGLDVTAYPVSQGVATDPYAGFGSEFVPADTSSGNAGVVDAPPSVTYGYGYGEDGAARGAYGGFDAPGGTGDAGDFGQATYGAEYAQGSNPVAFPGEQGSESLGAAFTEEGEQAGYGGAYGGEFGAEAGYTGEYGADANQTAYADGGGEGTVEVASGTRPYGGFTWEEVLEWVDYYRKNGTYTEEQLDEWVAGLQQGAVDAGYPANAAAGTGDVAAAAYGHAGVSYGADVPTGALEGYDAAKRGEEGLEVGGNDRYQGFRNTDGQDQNISLVTTVETEVTTTVTQVYQGDPRMSAPISGASRPLAGAFSALTAGRTTAGQAGAAFMGRAGALADWLTANKTDSGKITGPLPWELMSNATSAEGDKSSSDGSRASSPRAVSPKGAAFAAAAPASEVASLIADSTGLREEAFPPLQRPGNRAPPPTSMAMQAPPPIHAKAEGASLGRTGSMGSQVSWKSQGSSTSRNLGTPTSRQSYPAESQAPNFASLPGSPSARRAPDPGAERWEDVHKGYGTQQRVQPQYDHPNGASDPTLGVANVAAASSASLNDLGSNAATYGDSVDGSMAAHTDLTRPGVDGPPTLHPPTWDYGGATEYEGATPQEGVYSQVEGDTHSAYPQEEAIAAWGGDPAYGDGITGHGSEPYALEGLDTTATEGWGADVTIDNIRGEYLQTTADDAYLAGDQRDYSPNAGGGDWQMSEGFPGDAPQDTSHFGKGEAYQQAGDQGDGATYFGTAAGGTPQQALEAGEEADYFAPNGPPLRALSAGVASITGITSDADFDAALLAFVSQPLAARHPSSRSVPGTPARPQPLASPFAPRRRSQDARPASPGFAPGSGISGFLPTPVGFAAGSLSPPSVTITEIADAGVGTPDTGIPLTDGSVGKDNGEIPGNQAFGSTSDLTAAAAQDEDFAFQVDGGGDGWAGDDMDIDLGMVAEGEADTVLPLREVPPVRTSGLSDAGEPSLAGWGSDDQFVPPPKIMTQKPPKEDTATDLHLREEAASLRPLTIPPSPHAASIPLSVAMTSEDALAELETRKSAGESELEVALRENRINAERAVALEDQLEDALRDMRALKEQNDVLRAQAATSLEGTRDDATPASPPEDLQDKLEEAFQQIAALREENDALRAQATTLLEEAKDETAEAPASEELQEQLNNALQDMAALREENDALRAQAATLLEESKDAEPPVANNGSLDALRAELEAERAAVAQLQEQLGGSTAGTSAVAAENANLAATSAAAEAERASLAARLAALEEENVAMGDELLAKDEEIENLQGQVLHARKAGGPSADLAARLEQATQQIAALQQESAALKAQVQERETSLAELTLEVEQVRSAGATQGEKEAELTAQLEEAAGKLQELEELRAERERHTAEVEKRLEETLDELKAREGAVLALERQAVEFQGMLAEKDEDLDKADAVATEAATQLDASTQQMAKMSELLQTRDAEVASMRTTLEEAQKAKTVAERRALKMKSERDQALRQARADKTRLETERDEALALAHAEVERLSAAAAAPAPALAAVQAELEAERARALELVREVEQFKEQGKLDFDRLTLLAEENQQLLDKLDELGGDDDALNDALTERDRLAVRCAELEAAAAAAPPSADPAEVEGLRAELAASQAELDAAKSALAMVQQQIEAAMSHKEAELTAAHGHQEMAMKEIQSLNDALEKKVRKILSVSEELVRAKLNADKTEAGLKVGLAEARAALAAGENAAQAEKAALRDALHAAEEQLRVLQEESGTVEAERDALQRQLSATEAYVAALKHDVAKAREGANAKEATLAEILQDTEARVRAAQLEAESAQSGAVVEVKTMNDLLEGARAELAAAKRLHDADLEVLRNQLAAQQAELADVRAVLAAAQTGNAGEDGANEEVETLKQRLAEAEAEAADLFARQTQLEEEAAAAEGEAARAAKARDEALARAAEAEARLTKAVQVQAAAAAQGPAAGTAAGDTAASDLESRVAELEAELDTQQRDHSDLLACLGQETAKVDALVAALEEQGIDTEQLLEKVEEEYGYGDELDEADDGDEAEEERDDVNPKEHLSGGHVGVTSTPSGAELDLAPGSPTGGARGKAKDDATPLETGDEMLREAPAPACISVKLGAADEEVNGTPDGEKVASSGTTSDGSWREVHLRPVESDWAEVPIQGSRPESPVAEPPAQPSGQQGASGPGSGEVGRGPIPFGQPAKSLADAFGRGSAPAASTPSAPVDEPNLDLDGWGDDWADVDA